ncbi:DUF1128 domain-containing protein [Lentibacillus saliphilus]|uniref:DUF1128 domain-containing protein n=1 Tax=Lentibacillus saliphilus TaxID=2737028 RepID=UPI001C2F4F86|nr:DUF1128 domain-containing protein [Lentibacillus saliphilus]
MNLERPNEQNLKYILEDLTKRLGVVNRSLMDYQDYDLSKYDDLKMMYDIVKRKGQLSTSETEAFVNELRHVRK